MILVAGGTGRLGSQLVRRLRARDVAVRVLTRDPARATRLADVGAEIATGDLRDADSVHRAADGVHTIISAAHGLGARDVSPDSVDRLGNRNLVNAASRARSAVVLMSIVGASADSAMELFRAKHDAERMVRESSVPWTIVRATSFMETWATIIGEPLRTNGRALVFGRGENPINFVSVGDVAALLDRVADDDAQRGEVIEIGGPANVTFTQFAETLETLIGRTGSARHVPRPVLRAMSVLLRVIDPMFARQTRAAVVMDTHDMTFDSGNARRRFPDLPLTSIASALASFVRDGDAALTSPAERAPQR